MKFLKGLLAVGAVAVSALVSGSAAAPTPVSAALWARLDTDCPSGICRYTNCYTGGGEQCSDITCAQAGCPS